MQETVVGEINFDDDSAKKVIMVVVEYAKTYPRFEENYKFISRELTILNRYYWISMG